MLPVNRSSGVATSRDTDRPRARSIGGIIDRVEHILSRLWSALRLGVRRKKQDPAAPAQRVVKSRAKFWEEFREGQREAEARSAKGPD